MLNPAKPELRVTVFSDYTCPFCYIGYVRLEQLRDEYDLKVNWCMVEIHPDTPAQGMPVTELGYAPEQFNAMMSELMAMAQTENILILPQTITTNTHNALLLAEAVKNEGREVFYALHHRLFEAYFGEGVNIGDTAILQELALEVGVGPDTLQRAWTDTKYTERLNQNLVIAQRFGVTGTPTYFIGERKLTGAISIEALRQAAHETIPL